MKSSIKHHGYRCFWYQILVGRYMICMYNMYFQGSLLNFLHFLVIDSAKMPSQRAVIIIAFDKIIDKQGKSEGFESCDRPGVRKRPIWVKISDVLSRVTLKFDGLPWKTIGHLFFAVSCFVQHFVAIGEFKLELQSGNAQFGSNSMIFRAVWPWNLKDDLEKQ